MGVQPPSNDIDEEPDVVEFGIAALDARVEQLDISFPVDAATLRREHGDVAIPIDAAGTELTLAETLSESNRERFDSRQEMLNALHPVFEEKREATSRSIIAQLRMLVPF